MITIFATMNVLIDIKLALTMIIVIVSGKFVTVHLYKMLKFN